MTQLTKANLVLTAKDGVLTLTVGHNRLGEVGNAVLATGVSGTWRVELPDCPAIVQPLKAADSPPATAQASLGMDEAPPAKPAPRKRGKRAASESPESDFAPSESPSSDE